MIKLNVKAAVNQNLTDSCLQTPVTIFAQSNKCLEWVLVQKWVPKKVGLRRLFYLLFGIEYFYKPFIVFDRF
jgi:hypothetical protein